MEPVPLWVYTVICTEGQFEELPNKQLEYSRVPYTTKIKPEPWILCGTIVFLLTALLGSLIYHSLVVDQLHERIRTERLEWFKDGIEIGRKHPRS